MDTLGGQDICSEYRVGKYLSTKYL